MASTYSSRIIERAKNANPWLRLTVIVMAGVAYLAVYLAFDERATAGLSALAAIPVLLAGWLFGYRGGLLAFSIFFLVNPLLISSSTGAPLFWDAYLRRGNIAGNIVLLLVGMGAAWLSRLHGYLYEQIRAREAAAQVLAESELRYRTLFENAPIGLGVTDEQGTFLAFNDAMLLPGGYLPEDIHAMGTVDKLYFDLKDRVWVMKQLLETGRVHEQEVRFRRKDGSAYHGLLSVIPIQYGGSDGRLAIVRDVTDEVETTRNLIERESFLSLLNEITRIALSATDFKPSLQVLVDSLVALFQSDACYLAFWDEELQTAVPIAASGLLQESYDQILARPNERTFTEAVLDRGTAILVEDVFSSELVSPSVIENFPESALLGLPMIAGDRKIGSILVTYNDPSALHEVDVVRAEHVAAQIALAISKIQLLNDARRRAEQLETLYELTQSLNERQDLPQLLNLIVEIAGNLLEANAGSIYLYDPVEDALVVRVSTADFLPIGTRLIPGEGMAGRVFDSRVALRVADYSTWPGRADRFEGMPFRAVVEAPLIYAGEVLGVLSVYQVGSNRKIFTEAEEHLLSLFASQAAAAVHNARLFEDLEESHRDLSRAYDTTLEGWARALDLRDSPTEGHAKRVTEMTLRLARRMGIAEKELVHIRRGALLHDIGKMSIPDAILLKKGPLNEEEWEIMKMHPVYAYEFIWPVKFLRPALAIPYFHHERWDGSGYPSGVKGDNIPLAARIFAVVDAWDALRSDRPYRKAWPEEDILQLLKEGAGSHFDPHIVDVFLKMLAESPPPRA